MCDPTQAGETATLHQKLCRMTGGIPCKTVHGLGALLARAIGRSPQPHAGCGKQAPAADQPAAAPQAQACGCGGHGHAKAGPCSGEHKAAHAGDGCCGGHKAGHAEGGQGGCGCGGKAAQAAESEAPQP